MEIRPMKWFDQRHAVLVPFDFSDESVSAVATALGLAEGPEDLHVLHVLPPLHPSDPGVVWDTVDDASRIEHAKAAMRERLQDLAPTAHLTVMIGNPGNLITEQADALRAGLIVIPSHGRTGLRRVLLGSVAERVVRHAHCPVLVLKKPPGDSWKD